MEKSSNQNLMDNLKKIDFHDDLLRIAKDYDKTLDMFMKKNMLSVYDQNFHKEIKKIIKKAE